MNTFVQCETGASFGTGSRAAAEPMLVLRGVAKAYDGAAALQPTDLDVQRGKTTVLIGPSGCGKSTLLRLMIGLIVPDAGTVSFDGAVLTAANVRSIRHRMGYVIQEGGLFPHLSARDNVTLMGRYLRWPGRRIERRLDELVALTRYPREALVRFPVELSGGQRQRVSLMRALLLDPDVLLLDEPLGALDPVTRADLQADLRPLFQTLRKTVVLVTHDMAEAAFFSDTIVMLRAGRVVQQGTLVELARSPAEPFVTQFINAQRAPLAALGGLPG